MSNESGTVVLDARSKEKYDLLLVKGAINLDFSDITVAKMQAFATAALNAASPIKSEGSRTEATVRLLRARLYKRSRKYHLRRTP